MRTTTWIAVRVATAVAALTVLSALVFWATEVLPGDAAGIVSGPDATNAERAAVRSALGLDRPVLERYLAWMTGALHGDFGASLVSGRDIGPIVAARFSTSVSVLVPASLGILVLAGVLGTLMGLRAGGRLDRALTTATLGMMAVPEFLIATLLTVVLAVWIPLLPAVAIVPPGQHLWQHPEVVVLPALALVIGGSGSTMRLLRASVAQTAAAPFAEFARLNGVRGLAYFRLVAVSAAGPAIHAFTIMIAGLFGGAIVVETLFNVPGLGYEITRAVGNRDIPLIQALSLVLSATVLGILLGGDLCARALRQRTTREGDASCATT